MTYLSDRLAELREHLDHLEEIGPRVRASDLASDRSLANDVLFSLLMVAQRVIDLAGELSIRRGLRFEDYDEAVRNLAIYEEFPDALIRRLEPLPGFRNALLHHTEAFDLEAVPAILARLDAVERFATALSRRVGGRRAQRATTGTFKT